MPYLHQSNTLSQMWQGPSDIFPKTASLCRVSVTPKHTVQFIALMSIRVTQAHKGEAGRDVINPTTDSMQLYTQRSRHLLVESAPVVGFLIHGIGCGIVVQLDKLRKVVRHDLRVGSNGGRGGEGRAWSLFLRLSRWAVDHASPRTRSIFPNE